MAEGGTCQDTEKTRPSEEHSLSGDSRERDLSDHGKKLTERGALTLWGQQREGLVGTRKEIDQARDTHVLKTAEGGTRQDMERNRPSKGNSLPGDGRGGGLVRTWKEADQARGTHQLETTEGGTCQDMGRNRPSEGHSLPGDGGERDLSGH
jgi:hypothetical protein